MRVPVRVALLATACSVVIAPAAHAGVVVWRSTTSTAIWEAKDDGTGKHVIAHGSAPYISPDATRLAYGNADNQLTVVRLGASAVPVRVVPGEWGGFATWSPNSRQLGAQIGTSLVVVPANGRPRVTLAHADHGWLSFNPASTRVALDGYNDITKKPDLPLQTMSVGGGAATQLQDRATGATGISWGPGDMIAFAVSAANRPVHTEILTPGGKPTTAARSAYDTYPDGWSDDGTRMLIEEDRTTGVRVGYVTMATGKLTLVPGDYTYVQGMSHDGTRALVTGHDAKGRYVAVVSLSRGRRLVTLRNAVDASWTS
jgi:hypothetical protein